MPFNVTTMVCTLSRHRGALLTSDEGRWRVSEARGAAEAAQVAGEGGEEGPGG